MESTNSIIDCTDNEYPVCPYCGYAATKVYSPSEIGKRVVRTCRECLKDFESVASITFDTKEIATLYDEVQEMNEFLKDEDGDQIEATKYDVVDVKTFMEIWESGNV